MDTAFWLQRWHDGQTAFHEGVPNRWLEEHVALLGPGAGRRVLVPLCGKSVDLAFLAAHGFDVVGVELAPVAAEAFFADAGLPAERSVDGDLVRLRARGIEIVVGDFFATGPDRLGTFDAWYDRAAVVALPSELRDRYAATLRTLLKPGAQGLVVTFEHDGPPTAPPFTVSAAELARLWPTWAFSPLGQTDDMDANGRLRERGATFATEHAYAARTG